TEDHPTATLSSRRRATTITIPAMRPRISVLVGSRGIRCSSSCWMRHRARLRSGAKYIWRWLRAPLMPRTLSGCLVGSTLLEHRLEDEALKPLVSRNRRPQSSHPMCLDDILLIPGPIALATSVGGVAREPIPRAMRWRKRWEAGSMCRLAVDVHELGMLGQLESGIEAHLVQVEAHLAGA